MTDQLGAAVASAATVAGVLAVVWWAVGPGAAVGRSVRLRSFLGWSALWWLAYMLVRAAVPAGRWPDAVSDAHAVEALSGGAGVERWFTGVPSWLRSAAGGYYSTAHLVVTASVLVWLARRHPSAWRTQAPVLLVCSLLALGCFALGPVAPPRLLGFGHFQLTSVQSAEALPWAALPSLHCAWALWCDQALWPLVRRLRPLLGVHTVLTVVVVLVTGNHWVADVVFGFALVVLSGRLVRRGARGRAARPGPGPRPPLASPPAVSCMSVSS